MLYSRKWRRTEEDESEICSPFSCSMPLLMPTLVPTLVPTLMLFALRRGWQKGYSRSGPSNNRLVRFLRNGGRRIEVNGLASWAVLLPHDDFPRWRRRGSTAACARLNWFNLLVWNEVSASACTTSLADFSCTLFSCNAQRSVLGRGAEPGGAKDGRWVWWLLACSWGPSQRETVQLSEGARLKGA